MKTILFGFEELSSKDKGIKSLIKAFDKAGGEVISHAVDATTKRTSGVSYREIRLTFSDSQVVTMRIKSTGDIFQVLLNGKVIPVKNQDDHGKAVAEIATLVQSNAAKFQRALAKTKIELPKGIRSAAPKIESALVEKVDALKTAINLANEELQSYGVAVES